MHLYNNLVAFETCNVCHNKIPIQRIHFIHSFDDYDLEPYIIALCPLCLNEDINSTIIETTTQPFFEKNIYPYKETSP